MLKVLTTCCVTVLALALALALWLWPSKPKIPTQQIREPPSAASHPSVSAPAVAVTAPVSTTPVGREGPRQALKKAKDHFQLALSILPLAKAGNAEAQYVLFRVLWDCHRGSPSLYGEFDTREKAHEYAAINTYSTEEAETLFDQCHGFYTSQASVLGTPWEWLQKATDAGYPAALADTAFERLLQESMKVGLPAGLKPEGIVALPPIGGDADPRALLTEALPSADPQVLAQIGELQHLLHPQEPRTQTQINRLAWVYVSCQRGNDCSGFGPTSPINCAPTDTNCLGVPDMMMRMAHNDWAPVQEEVNQINAQLDAQQWTDLAQYIN
jgi:hypothetical protein